MDGIISNLIILIAKMGLCLGLDPAVKFRNNVAILGKAVLFVAFVDRLASSIRRKITGNARLPSKNFTRACKLLLTFIIFLQRLSTDRKFVNAFFACPLDMADFAFEMSTYLFSLDVLLVLLTALFQITGVSDGDAIAACFVIVLGLITMNFNKETEQAFNGVASMLKICLDSIYGLVIVLIRNIEKARTMKSNTDVHVNHTA